MNYRHAYHAGNFGDCIKQALLFRLVCTLRQKAKPFSVLETHAGAGAYDLAAEPAARTGEWHAGIGRLLSSPRAHEEPRGASDPLAEYLAAIKSSPRFPGSALLMRRLLRAGDHLVCCELHPEEFASLKRCFHGDRAVSLHHRDGWEALGALLPPTPRRGLVFIDPPYEQPDEWQRLAAGIELAHKRWAGGVIAAWYPIKHRTPVRGLHEHLKANSIPDIVAAELTLREPIDPRRMNGAGMVIVNPPQGFRAAAEAILAALLARLGTGENGASSAVNVLSSERASPPARVASAQN